MRVADMTAAQYESYRAAYKRNNKKSYHADPEARIASTIKWQRENKEKYNAKQRAWYAKHKEKTVDRKLLQRYGITLEERNRLFEEQGNCCGVCQREEPDSIKGWHIDHCHSTQKVRGIVCHACNIFLGNIEKSAERHARAVAYLEKHNSPAL